MAVDGSEIRLSPVEVGSFIPVVFCRFFFTSQVVSRISEPSTVPKIVCRDVSSLMGVYASKSATLRSVEELPDVLPNIPNTRGRARSYPGYPGYPDSRLWFHICLMFTPTWGKIPSLII